MADEKAVALDNETACWLVVYLVEWWGDLVAGGKAVRLVDWLAGGKVGK